MTTIHHFDVPSHPSGTSNPGEAADGIAAERSGDKLRTAGITVYQAIHEFPPHGMVIRARGREQTTESITLTKAHKLFHRFHFIHCGQPSPPAFTLPQTPEKKPTRKQKIRLGQAGLAPENWLIVKQKPGGELVILHKHTNTIRVIPALGQ